MWAHSTQNDLIITMHQTRMNFNLIEERTYNLSEDNPDVKIWSKITKNLLK